MNEFFKQGAPKEPETFPFVLIGNKIDCESEREVQNKEVNQLL